jgi:peptidoglycan/LPS O-acetylase OafA/YrhL
LIFHPALLGTRWFNFAFWTLMIEFQFYLLIGLVLPLLLDRGRQMRTVGLILLMLAINLIDHTWYFAYSPYFTLGLLVFLLHHGSITRPLFAFLVLAASVICLVQGAWVPLLFAMSATAVILSRIDISSRPTDLLGAISYSLYITHVPVGYFAETAVKRITDIHQTEVGKLFLLLFYTAIALVAAWIFYRTVEKPFLTYSKRIAHKRPRSSPSAEMTTDAVHRE